MNTCCPERNNVSIYLRNGRSPLSAVEFNGTSSQPMFMETKNMTCGKKPISLSKFLVKIKQERINS
jgi:hypothetical protein